MGRELITWARQLWQEISVMTPELNLSPITMQAADVSHIMLAFYSSICETPNSYAKLSGALCHVPCVNCNNEIINFLGLTQNG